MWKRKKLEQEGATVLVVEKLGSNWLQPLADRWKDIMTKLRLWELVQYDRIIFLDADTFLLKPMDGIFNDPAAQHPQITREKDEIKPDEPPLPRLCLCVSLRNLAHKSPLSTSGMALL